MPIPNIFAYIIKHFVLDDVPKVLDIVVNNPGVIGSYFRDDVSDHE